jgi:hypothetical protein
VDQVSSAPDDFGGSSTIFTTDVAENCGDPPANDEVVWRALKWSLACLGVLAVVIFFGWLLFAPLKVAQWDVAILSDIPIAIDLTLPAEAFPDVAFTDVTEAAGIDFVHFNGAEGRLLMPENLGSGCAFLDYDRDGDQDILLINSSQFPPHEHREPAPHMGLYQNDGQGRFQNVTSGSGLDVSFYGTGVAVGDYDGDGWTDVFVSALGPNHLFRNLGQGKFLDVTETAGVAGESHRWSTSAGFLDYDNDGDLDLFVCNYVDWSQELDAKLDRKALGVADYLTPWQFQGTFNYLYRNESQGRFTDVSHPAGVQVVNQTNGLPKGKGFGVVFCDLDEDGWQDMIVANDQVPNFLFHNQRDGTFREIGEAAGIGHGQDGVPVAGMGIDIAHLYEDSRATIGVANLEPRAEAMFRSQQPSESEPALKYVDEVLSMGMAAESQRFTTWGLLFLDFDLDGRLDLYQCNGSVNCEGCTRLLGTPYLQPSQLFWNCGPDRPIRLAPLPAAKRPSAIERPLMARGASYADIDGDGDLDLLIAQNGRPAVLLRNDQKTGNHWIRLELRGTGGNHEAIGAQIEVRVGGNVLRRRVGPTRGFCSQVELPVTIGLGSQARPEEVKVLWPDGSSQVVSDVRLDGLTKVRKIVPQG